MRPSGSGFDLSGAAQSGERPEVARQFSDLSRGDRPTDLIVGYRRQKLLSDPSQYTLLVIEFWASASREPDVQRRSSDQHERILVAVAELLEDTAARQGVVLALEALELNRLSPAIAHGLALERLMNREKVDERMIEVAFALHQLSGSNRRKRPRAADIDGPSVKGAKR